MRTKRLSVVGLVMGLIVGVTLGIAGIALAGNSPPTSVNTCTPVNHHGVYGKPKVTTADSCPGTKYFQHWPQPPTPPTLIGTQAGYADGANGHLWFVIIPASPYAAANHPNGPLAVAMGGTCSGIGASNVPLQDSGTTDAVVVSSMASTTNPGDFWGWDTGGSLPYPNGPCTLDSFSYSGDTTPIYKGF